MGKQRIIYEITGSRWFIIELLLGVILAAYVIFLGPYTLALLRAAAGNPAPLELGVFWPAIAVPLCLGVLAWWARCTGLAIGLLLGAALVVLLDVWVLPDAADLFG
jgi:hypothetical protein